MRIARTTGRRTRGSSLAELGPVMWLFLIFIMIPVLDLISLGLGFATVALMVSLGSREAATASTFGNAQAQCTATENQLAAFMVFAKLVPTTPPIGLTVNLMITPSTSSTTGNVYSLAQMVANPIGIDPANNVYQYIVTANYNILPLFNFSSTPFLNTVPGLGAPIQATYSATVMVEHPEGAGSAVNTN